MSLYNRLKIDMSVADELSFNPYYIATKSHKSGSFEIDKKQYVDLASNDYLGLSTDKRVLQGSFDAQNDFGASLCGTPIATGNSMRFSTLADRLAGFAGVESAVLFPSCFQANTSLFTSIAGVEDVILIDQFAHASLIQGVKSVGCKVMPFLHNNCDHLEKLLKRTSKYRDVFVVTESVFSTEGSIAPYDKITGLCDQYNATAVIDDSHGIGVLGENGRGVLEHFNIENYKGIYTASLGKALANSGGMIGGPKEFIDYLRYGCPGLIYSTALIPSAVGGLESVLDIIETEFSDLRDKLEKNREILHNSLVHNGFTVIGNSKSIISVRCGSMKDTIELAKTFFNYGMITTPFVEPSVPVNKGVLRIIPGAGISIERCEDIAEIIKKNILGIS
ncbi:MAG: pyridoxal phosphate-dependent aminotransferase family protein [Deltaproteobacteria bacterium]|nr:pyridoxal phosphate-dependent aminotransferase family protein [Deltaproteobacteria bacterium]